MLDSVVKKKDYNEWITKETKVVDFVEKVCVPQINNYHTVCYNDEHCNNTMGCYNDRCIDYFSLANGRESPSKFFCLSGNVENGKCQDIELMTETDKTDSSFNCLNGNSQCKYFIVGGQDTDTVTKPCTCSKSPEPKAYCPADTKNSKFSNRVANQKAAFIKDVHTTLRFDHSKLKKEDFFPEFEGAVDKVYTGLKFEATESSAFLKSTLSLFLLALFVIA